MAINLASKYSDKIASVYTLASLVAGKTSNEYDFSGVKSVKVYTPVTVDPVDYTRSGTNRYGTPTEMQDIIQELTMSQDKSFSLIIDKGNNEEQMLIKNAGKMMKLETEEKIVPMVDKYALGVYVNKAGKVASVATKPTKTTIVSAVSDAVQALDDAAVPQGDRYLYITGEMYSLLRQSTEFLGIDSLGEKALSKGVVGEIFGAKVVKTPTSYLPENCYFLVTHKNSCLLPYKIRDAKIHQDPPGISGALLEGRNNYDAFVLGARANGVYALVLASDKVKTPSASLSNSALTVTSDTSGADIYYTTDGSDPRYSTTAEKYSSALTVASGDKIKAYAVKSGMFASDLLEYTVS